MRSLLPIVLFVAPVAACDVQRAPMAVDAGPPAEVAASDLRAPKAPPALRLPHAPAPALPDLPALAAHASPASPPRGANLDGAPCHSIWTGSSTAPLACARALFTAGDQGAVAIVPRRLLSHDVASLPSVVDHRLDGTEGPVRNQGATPACTAFAASAALDHALARWGGGNPSVSVMQLWSRYHSPEVVASLRANIGQKLAPEQSWPFSAPAAVSWVPCREFSRTPREGCGQPVDDTRARQAAAAAVVGEFTEVQYLGSSPDTLVLEEELAAGQDVILTLEPSPAFVPKGQTGSRYIPDYVKSAGPDSGHSLLVAGYAHFPHGTYFLLHNSWGTGWGDGGYAWMHETTLRRWSKEAVSVDAEPVVRAPGSRPVRQRAQTTCASGLVPDSIQATCTQPCPDRSPRHDGICPVAGQCPAGFVNLTGACVLAAPNASGTDPTSHVAWTCGPGGCTYVLPRSSDAVCTGSACQASCPAPDFILAKMGSELVCVE